MMDTFLAIRRTIRGPNLCGPGNEDCVSILTNEAALTKSVNSHHALPALFSICRTCSPIAMQLVSPGD
ncbi:MAG: hypothetical protein Q4E66_12465, partial [Comamonadaceae bacterium]|nr:hypothetical protein [Comamonadaceae bacterium]